MKPLAANGLLIVNADDWGHSEQITDAIRAAFDAGRITSTSGMVHMADSERAAALATEAGLPVGLHLNLTEPFSDPDAPLEARERQRRLIGFLGGTPAPHEPPDMSSTANLRRWLYDPRIQAEVDRSIADQLERFRELYGREPTHFDGHNHVDLCPNVFRSRSIPRESKLRNSLYRFPIERSAAALLRSARQAARSRRFASTRHLFHIRELSLDAPDRRLTLAGRVPVEVMGHPGFAAENEMLMSDDWGARLREFRLGSFADLDTRPLPWRDSFRVE